MEAIIAYRPADSNRFCRREPTARFSLGTMHLLRCPLISLHIVSSLLSREKNNRLLAITVFPFSRLVYRRATIINRYTVSLEGRPSERNGNFIIGNALLLAVARAFISGNEFSYKS